MFSVLYQGDPIRLLTLKSIISVVESDNLMKNAERTGMMVKAGLRELQGKYPVFNARGQGLYLAFDALDGGSAGKIEKELRKYGVFAGGCGEKSIRFRAPLIFTTKHADVYLSVLEHSLKQLYGSN